MTNNITEGQFTGIVQRESTADNSLFSDNNLNMVNEQTRRYTSTISNEVSSEMSLFLRDSLFSRIPAPLYHDYTHFVTFGKFAQMVYLDIESDPFNLLGEYQKYNSVCSEEFRLPTFDETYGLFKCISMSHDCGNYGQLNPKLIELIDDKLSLEEFVTRYQEIINGEEIDRTQYLETSEINVSKGAEDRSSQISTFFFRMGVANKYLSEKDNPWRNIAPEKVTETYNTIFKSGSFFIKSMIEHTKIDKNESTNPAFKSFVGFLDIVSGYIGKSPKEIVQQVSNLAKERVNEKDESKIAPITALNFPWIQFIKLFPQSSERIKIIHFYNSLSKKYPNSNRFKVKLNVGMPNVLDKNKLPTHLQSQLSLPMSWKAINELFSYEPFIKTIEQGYV